MFVSGGCPVVLVSGGSPVVLVSGGSPAVLVSGSCPAVLVSGGCLAVLVSGGCSVVVGGGGDCAGGEPLMYKLFPSKSSNIASPRMSFSSSEKAGIRSLALVALSKSNSQCDVGNSFLIFSMITV